MTNIETEMTTKGRMLSLIDTFTDEAPIVREIAAWLVCNEIWEVMDEDAEDESAAYMDALRKQYPQATDDEITLGHNMMVAVGEAARPQ